jgi:RNA polymerase sigma-70 factor (ECF subfamily)
MKEREERQEHYQDWGAVMEVLCQDDSAAKQLAFRKLNRLISSFLVTLQAWDHRDQWEDLRQTVLMKLIKSYYSQGQLREPRAFVAYVRTITRNEFYDFLKAHGGPKVEEISEQEQEDSSDVEVVLAVRSAFGRLPEEQRRAIQTVYLEGKTYEEAAEATAIPLGSLKRYLRLGLSQLREQLAGVLKAG